MYDAPTATKIYVSQSEITISDVASIYVKCDLVSNSYDNSSGYSNIIYSFYPTVIPNTKIVERPGEIIYLPVNKRKIETIKIWLTDQNNNYLDFRGDYIVVNFNLKKFRNNKCITK